MNETHLHVTEPAANARERLRVLTVLPNLARGGAEVQLIHLMQGLPQDRVETQLVTLLSLPPERSLEARVEAAGLNWTDLSVAATPERFMGARHAARNLLRARRQLERVIRTYQPDIVYSRLWFAGLTVALLNRHKLGFRHVTNEEAALVNDDDPGFVKQHLRRWVVAQADAWVVPTQGLYEQFVRAGGPAGRGHVIYNATPMPDCAPRTAHTTPIRFAAMGRLAPTKGFDRLLKASALLKARGVAFTVDVAGMGPDKDALEAHARALGLGDTVRFVGYTQDPLRFLMDHDAFVLTSRDEGFANVIVEAMACCLPVVSFDIDFGPRELITPGVTGFLVPDGDLSGLAHRMADLTDPELRARFGAAGRAQAIGRYGVDSMVNDFMRVFEGVMTTPSNTRARNPGVLLPGGRPSS